MIEKKPIKLRRRNDRHDPDPWELKLIRAGHHIWRPYRLEKAKFGGYPSESGPLWEALQTIWNAKREYRAELAAKRKKNVKVLVARLKARLGNSAPPVEHQLA